jgi:hypothetical protein
VLCNSIAEPSLTPHLLLEVPTQKVAQAGTAIACMPSGENTTLVLKKGGPTPGSFADGIVKPSCPTCFFNGVRGSATAKVVEAAEHNMLVGYQAHHCRWVG